MLNQADIRHLNQQFKGIPPEEIISWVALRSKRPVITSNFKPYAASLLHAVTEILPEIPVIWCDTGYNTPQTYRFANNLISQLSLNIKIYTPLQTSAYREAIMGMPHIDDPVHGEFTDQVKLEPFRRAMSDYKPDVWFTNIRQGQTAFRDTLDILSLDRQGRLKVSPFYHWTDTQLESYLQENDLPNEFTYFDPTKVLENRECGLHL